jgi:hypothetical protein
MFIYEYGVDQYLAWRDLTKRGEAISLREFEKRLRVSWGQAATSPVVDAYEKETR